MVKKRAVSPQATGGSGTIFEYRVAAMMLSHLLCGSHPPGLEVPVVRVGLQQRVRGHLLDDVVVYGEPGPISTEFQVKQTLTVTPGDTEFIEFLTQALHALADQRAESVTPGDRALGLIAQGEASAVDELAMLANWAKSHHSHKTLDEFFVHDVTRKKYRDRLDQVRESVRVAIGLGAPDLGGVEATTHALLYVLHVWRPTGGDGGTDHRDTLDRLQSAADEFGELSGTLFAHLTALAETWGPFGAVVTAEEVKLRLRRRGLRSKAGAQSATSATEGIDVDAIVRGPLQALDLVDELAAAESLQAAGDPAAVDALGAIAARLRAKRFGPHATMMLRRRADALQAIGRDDDASLARAELAWADIDRVRVWEAGFALADSDRDGSTLTLSDAAERVRSAVSAAVWVAKGGSLGSYVDSFDRLGDNDPFLLRAAVFLSEEAVAADHPQLILDRLDRLETIATGTKSSTGEDGATLTVRLRMCMADASGDWIQLLRQVRLREPRQVVAWVHARFARYLALSGDGEGAQDFYLEAIERACTEEMFDESADWLYALRTVRFWYESFDGDDQHPRAQALRSQARTSTLPGSPHTTELALHAMLDQTTPREALQRAGRWRWQAVVRAQLTSELAAIKAIGTLQQQQGDLVDAIKSYTRAGDSAKVAIAAALVAESFSLDRSMLSPVPHRRAAVYTAVATAADLVDDAEAKAVPAAAGQP